MGSEYRSDFLDVLLEAESFEMGLEVAVSRFDGHKSRLAVMGILLGSYFGIPDPLKKAGQNKLDPQVLNLIEDWDELVAKKDRFAFVTKYLHLFDAIYEDTHFHFYNHGAWDKNVRMGAKLDFDKLQGEFIQEFDTFSQLHSEYGLDRYQEILEENNLKWQRKSLEQAKVETMDEAGVLAVIMGAIRLDKFSDGTLGKFIRLGMMNRWLGALGAFDEARKELVEITVQTFSMRGCYNYRLVFIGGRIERYFANGWDAKSEFEGDCDIEAMQKLLTKVDLMTWDYHMEPNYSIMDGLSWQVGIKYCNEPLKVIGGYFYTPRNWVVLQKMIGAFKRYYLDDIVTAKVRLNQEADPNSPGEKGTLQEFIKIDRMVNQLEIKRSSHGFKFAVALDLKGEGDLLIEWFSTVFFKIDDQIGGWDQRPVLELSATMIDGEIITKKILYGTQYFDKEDWLEFGIIIQEQVAPVLKLACFNESLLDLGQVAGKVIYCSVVLDGYTRSYYYLGSREINIGDRVAVPFGAENQVRHGQVVEVAAYELDNVPFSLNKTKTIITKL